jgi:hypothetical protein
LKAGIFEFTAASFLAATLFVLCISSNPSPGLRDQHYYNAQFEVRGHGNFNFVVRQSFCGLADHNTSDEGAI